MLRCYALMLHCYAYMLHCYALMLCYYNYDLPVHTCPWQHYITTLHITYPILKVYSFFYILHSSFVTSKCSALLADFSTWYACWDSCSGYLVRVSSLRNLPNSFSRVFSVKDKRFTGWYDFAILRSLPGFGMKIILTSLRGFDIWPIANELLYTLIKDLIIRSSPFCRPMG